MQFKILFRVFFVYGLSLILILCILYKIDDRFNDVMQKQNVINKRISYLELNYEHLKKIDDKDIKRLKQLMRS